MKKKDAPLLCAALATGCPIRVGTARMLEIIPAYLEFFGFGASTSEELRGVATPTY